MVAAIAISDGGNPWDAGLQDVVPDLSAANAIKTTVEREVTLTIAVEAVTAGKLRGWLRYVLSE